MALVTGLIEKTEDEESLLRTFSQVWGAASENSSHPYQSGKKKRAYPKDYTADVQMPSRIDQFSSQLTSHGTVAMEQFAKDRNLIGSPLDVLRPFPSFLPLPGDPTVGNR